jgi:arginyl-tRNA--protein-N-Asp/Glu arginylyltransferase
MSMFIKGLKYIIPCQSRLLHPSIDSLVKEHYQTLLNTVQNCLKDNRMSISDERAQQAFSELQNIVHELHVRKLHRKLGIRAQNEYALVRSMRRLIQNRPNIIVRRTDKSKVFYIGKTDDFLHKATEHMIKTNAYEEIQNDKSPLQNNFKSVKMLLDFLFKHNIINKEQRNRLLPKMNELELAHLHFIPKPHKVNRNLFQIYDLYFLFSLSIN